MIWRYEVHSCRKKERQDKTSLFLYYSLFDQKVHALVVLLTSFGARRGH
jgi:hypothetical protein